MTQPTQPIHIDKHGTARFKKNPIVDFLYHWAAQRGMSLNELARMSFSDEDRSQFAQLIGYSVSGYGDLSYAVGVEEADKIVELLVKTGARE